MTNSTRLWKSHPAQAETMICELRHQHTATYYRRRHRRSIHITMDVTGGGVCRLLIQLHILQETAQEGYSYSHRCYRECSLPPPIPTGFQGLFTLFPALSSPLSEVWRPPYNVYYDHGTSLSRPPSNLYGGRRKATFYRADGSKRA